MGITGASQNSYTLDAEYLLRTFGAQTTSGLGTGNQSVDFGGAYYKGEIIIDVAAMDVVSTNEIYDIIFVLTNTAAFSDNDDLYERISISLGAAGAKRTSANADSVVGRYTLGLDNEMAGTIYRYGRIQCVIGGTTPSISYQAFMARNQG